MEAFYSDNDFECNKLTFLRKVSNKNEGGKGRGQGEEVAQTMYTHMNKCKNNK
jgi:hypothetical protein